MIYLFKMKNIYVTNIEHDSRCRSPFILGLTATNKIHKNNFSSKVLEYRRIYPNFSIVVFFLHRCELDCSFLKILCIFKIKHKPRQSSQQYSEKKKKRLFSIKLKKYAIDVRHHLLTIYSSLLFHT